MDHDIIPLTVAAPASQVFESLINRVIALFTAGDHSHNLTDSIPLHDLFPAKFPLVLSCNKNNIADRALFKLLQRIIDKRSAVQKHILLPDAAVHPLSFPCRQHYSRRSFAFSIRHHRSPNFRFGTALRSHPALEPPIYS